MKTITIQLEEPYVEGLKRQARGERMSLQRYIETWVKGSVTLEWSIDKKGRLKQRYEEGEAAV